MFNLIVDIHVMVAWQMSKRASADQCHLTVTRAQVHNSSRLCHFLKLSADQKEMYFSSLNWNVISFVLIPQASESDIDSENWYIQSMVF